jgi:dipeptidyl aminopeptidase/acylaminoacyl peptidase
MKISLAALSLAAVGVLTSPSQPRAQAKRAMEVADLITAVRVGNPQLSPDGAQVLFERTTTDPASGRRNADIWRVPADGSARPTLFIGGDKSDNTPRFFADGRVAFISTRDGAAQVYMTDAAGGNARAMTKVPGGVQPPLVVSRDGRRIAYVTDVYPSCADIACNERLRDQAEKDPVKVRELKTLGYRHWDEWRLGIRHHVYVTDVETGETHDVTPGDYDAPQHFYEDNAIAFSPDGATLAFASNRVGRDKEMSSTNRDVWLVPAVGGPLRQLTTNPAADEQPVFSPDGKFLAVRAQRRAGFESDRWYIDIYDLATGVRRTLFENVDMSADDIAFAPDGRSVYFAAADRGTHNVYVASLSGGAPSLVARGGAVAAFVPGPGFVIFAKSTLTSPPDLFRVGATGGAETPLTSENAAWTSQVEMPRVSSLTAKGAGGAPVQYWLFEPPGFDPSKKYPVVFIIHGGPQGDTADAWSTRWNPALWAAQGWIVAAPNPRGSTGFGQKFVDDISQDWCGKVMTDIGAVFDAVQKMPSADPRQMAVAGASYGGYAVDWIIGHDTRFKAAITHDGVFNLESMALTTEELWFTDWEFGGPPWSPAARANFARCSPHLAADRIRTPTLVVTNDQDFRVTVDQGLQLFTVLRRNGVPSMVLNFPDEGHWVLGALNSRRWHEEVFGWLKTYLGSTPERATAGPGN